MEYKNEDEDIDIIEKISDFLLREIFINENLVIILGLSNLGAKLCTQLWLKDNLLPAINLDLIPFEELNGISLYAPIRFLGIDNLLKPEVFDRHIETANTVLVLCYNGKDSDSMLNDLYLKSPQAKDLFINKKIVLMNENIKSDSQQQGSGTKGGMGSQFKVNYTWCLVKNHIIEKRQHWQVMDYIETHEYNGVQFDITSVFFIKTSGDFWKRIYNSDDEKINQHAELCNGEGALCRVKGESETLIEDFKSFVGETDPLKASPYTIRKAFGISIDQNAVHAPANLNEYKWISQNVADILQKMVPHKTSSYGGGSYGGGGTGYYSNNNPGNSNNAGGYNRPYRPNNNYRRDDNRGGFNRGGSSSFNNNRRRPS